MKILLVEDDYNLSETLKEILELEDYKVDIASSAKEAYEKAYNNRYDLYIFDINLPDENGIEILKHLRFADDKTPTIYITALTDIKTMAKAFESGAEDFIKKPFDVEELLIRLKAKFNKKNNEIKIKDISYNPITKEIIKNGKVISLGDTLTQIFDELATNLNRIVPKENLLEYTSEKSLRVNITKLKNKLGIDIKNIRGKGYMIEI